MPLIQDQCQSEKVEQGKAQEPVRPADGKVPAHIGDEAAGATPTAGLCSLPVPCKGRLARDGLKMEMGSLCDNGHEPRFVDPDTATLIAK